MRTWRCRTALAGLALTAVLGGCAGGSDLGLRHDSAAADEIATLWLVLAIGSAAIFAFVVGLLTWAVLRRRSAHAGEPDRAEPRGRVLVVAGGIVVPSILLVGLFALTIVALPTTSAPVSRTERGRIVVDVVARQWFWDVRYPQSGVRTANEIHVPVGEPVTVRLRSGDVVHSLWVPSLNRKIDAVPGRTNEVAFDAIRAGVFEGACAEFCGLQHAHMRLFVVAQQPAEFRAWLAREARPVTQPVPARLVPGEQLFLGSACVYCHTVAGTNASGTVGPDLTHVASRLSLGAATIPNSRGYLAGWILDPQHFKPGNKMPGTDLDGAELQALLDYLESLR